MIVDHVRVEGSRLVVAFDGQRPEKRPTPILPAQALSDGQILLHDVNDLDDLPVQRLRNPAYERIR